MLPHTPWGFGHRGSSSGAWIVAGWLGATEQQRLWPRSWQQYLAMYWSMTSGAHDHFHDPPPPVDVPIPRRPFAFGVVCALHDRPVWTVRPRIAGQLVGVAQQPAALAQAPFTPDPLGMGGGVPQPPHLHGGRIPSSKGERVCTPGRTKAAHTLSLDGTQYDPPPPPLWRNPPPAALFQTPAVPPARRPRGWLACPLPPPPPSRVLLNNSASPAGGGGGLTPPTPTPRTPPPLK